MKQINTFFCITAYILLCAVLSACGGTPDPVEPPVPVETAAPTDELDSAIREASTYLNGRIPRSSKIVFLNIRSDYPDLSEYILSILSENAVNDGVFSVVDRQQLDLIRAELDFQMSGEVSDESAQSIGKMLGAEGIVSGTISKIGPLYRVQIKAIEVQTAGVQGQWSRNIPADGGVTLAALTERYEPSSGSSPAPRSVVRTEAPRTQIASSAETPRTQVVPSSEIIVESPAPEAVSVVPQNVRYGTVTNTSVELLWNTVPRNVSYQVYYGTSNNPETANFVGPTPLTSYRIANLRSGTTYYFWVSTKEDGIESPKSATASVMTTNTYRIGDTGPAGGIVFYDKGNNLGGWRYLEAAPADIGSTQWQSSFTDISGTKDTIGSGMENTQILIRSSVRAAMLCDQYTLREFEDWFLPSKAELDLMYINLKMIRNIGDFSDGRYWTSTQDDRIWASWQDFSNGRQYGGYKDNTYFVRPIRQF